MTCGAARGTRYGPRDPARLSSTVPRVAGAGVWNPWLVMAQSWQLMTTGVFENGGRSAGPDAEIWRTDPCTLRDVVLDRAAMKNRLGVYPSVERVWALALLGRSTQAITEGHQLLNASKEKFRPLLVLAHAYRYQYQWHEAALLHT